MASPVASNLVAELPGATVLIAGAGAAGRSAASYLVGVGARVRLVDDRYSTSATELLAGVTVPGESISATLAGDLSEVDLLVVSPGFAPTHPLPVAAAAAGVPVWGEVELAWQLDRAGALGEPRTWLVVTGTNGKTTTTGMIEAIMLAAGRDAVACGNYGLTVLDAMVGPERADVLCAELSSFQLHWAPSVHADAAVVLNVAEDHLDWHGSFAAYAAAKALALQAAVAVVGDDDAIAATLPIGSTSRRIGFTGAEPQPGQFGVRNGMLIDRVFGDAAGVELVAADVIRPTGPSGIADALAAAALARAVGVSPEQVAAGLRAFSPAAHRGEVVATAECNGMSVRFVDDSKATNPHAATAALAGYDRVVLIAGGLLKGASVDELVITNASRLAGVVAIGRDRQIIVDAIARHAPEVPTVTVFTGDDGQVSVVEGSARPAHAVSPSDTRVSQTVDLPPSHAVMNVAVEQAWQLARESTRPVSAVLLAPAAASLDMFAGYGIRGDAFTAAARSVVDSAQASR
ncbi:UDP-N-acetylmuramoylalanine--D-glutamate ligase [Gordonia effusa NBRC 100432]|uniref:UDP-N-acetylmuramoylalanine--D-glutamate ligase n=1 Tax=Gordonia effusa NBRC 100432 TaxID=1077974 RepID=H0R2N5_9ACTN|nr:UDP-N-acetylmuramoyl-L-alanine--D-glutamate ligase [Gordonia effusa]GAB19336.1 UDP-N-acetylmuramoylalanine--D-glutamate ligase [Gordonia effusa NBRC 100432]